MMKNKWVLIVIFVTVLILTFFLWPDPIQLSHPNNQFSIKSDLNGFTPTIITTTTASVLFRDTWTRQITSTTRIITEIIEPTEIKDVSADVRAVVLGSQDETTKRSAEILKEVVGNDVDVVDLTPIQEIEPNVWASYGMMALYKIESTIRLAANVEITIPVILFLDNDNTLLTVFSWPYPDPSKEELMALANIGLGYYGVYVPLPKSRGIQVLTDEQKQMIADALEPVYKINVYIR